jgi:hypothetical protein
MKKITTTIIAGLLFLISNAQIKNGAIVLGGELSGYSGKNTRQTQATNNSNGFTLGAYFGKAIKQNQVLAITLGYSSSKLVDSYSNNDYNTSTTSIANVGLSYRKYNKILSVFYFYMEPNLTTSFGKNKQHSSFSTSANSSNSFGINASFSSGLAFRVYKKLQLEINLPQIVRLDYGNSKNSSTNPNSTTVSATYFNFNTSLSGDLFKNVGIGFKFVL